MQKVDRKAKVLYLKVSKPGNPGSLSSSNGLVISKAPSERSLNQKIFRNTLYMLWCHHIMVSHRNINQWHETRISNLYRQPRLILPKGSSISGGPCTFPNCPWVLPTWKCWGKYTGSFLRGEISQEFWGEMWGSQDVASLLNSSPRDSCKAITRASDSRKEEVWQ